MKKVDILFLYETKVRELENICLLKYELERRGYSVAVLNTWNELENKKKKYDAKVVVTHAMYHDGIYQFVKSIVGNVPKVVNMQCEQIGTVGDKTSKKSRYVLTGVAAQSMNICWGDMTAKRLREDSKIDQRYIRVTGNVSLDFCRKELRGYYRDRQQMLEEYGIPTDKEVNLFISSFSYVNLPQEIIQQSDASSRDEFIYLSNESFRKVLDWFKRLLSESDDQIILYRPHPAEAKNETLAQMCEDYKGRFFVISEHSVKQWISVCDKVFTWYSTSAVEAHAFGIPCAILRPHPMPLSREVEVFENSHFITEYQEFADAVRTGVEGSLQQDVFDSYYNITDTMSYVRVADAIEEVYKDDGYLIDFVDESQARVSVYQHIKRSVRRVVSFVADLLPEDGKFLAKYKTNQQPDAYTLQMQKSNFASLDEIFQIQQRIAHVLDLNKKGN